MSCACVQHMIQLWYFLYTKNQFSLGRIYLQEFLEKTLAAELIVKKFDEDHPWVASKQANLAKIHQKLGNYDMAN